jgi:hypothetical protein
MTAALMNQLHDMHSEKLNGLIPNGATSYTKRVRAVGDCLTHTIDVLTTR